MFIGVSGVAGSGKDFFVERLIESLKKRGKLAKRFSLADNLKVEAKSAILKKYGIDPTNCSREDKDIIRPELVKIAKQKRKDTSGRYWIDKLESRIEESELCDYYCISDIRYAEYESDELSWIKKEKKGILVHVCKYYLEDAAARVHLPANSEEGRNDPILAENADYHVLWRHGTSNPEKVIDGFLNWLNSNEKT